MPLIKSAVAGRTDRLPMAVPAESFVIPSDTVSGLGQGNTEAGAAILDKLLAKHLKDGGNAGAPIDIVAAGGEYLVPAGTVASIGGGSMDQGHRILTQLVQRVRAQTQKRLRSLPGPKR